jgi:DNA-binding MarR family transcriptional regulator
VVLVSRRLDFLVAAERPPSLTVLLTAAERALEAEIEEGLREAGYVDLRAAHAQVFVVFAPGGSHLTALAAKANMTKQAMAELVRHLEQRGYVEIEPDPRDRRAKMIRLTTMGCRARELCTALAAEADSRLVERFGDQGVLELRERLGRIADRQR